MSNFNLSSPQNSMQPSTKLCKYCGKELLGIAYFCPHCGQQLEANQQPNPGNLQHHVRRRKNKWTAFTLCLFLGIFGGHKFYEERYGLGVLYILTFGLFGIGWLIDCIALLCKPNPYYLS